MIIDSSAVLAILFAEEDAAVYSGTIESAPHCRMSVANWLETAIRIDLKNDAIASNAFDDFMRESKIILEAVDLEQADIARSAYRAYGKGTGHPAGLNFGDCFAYALAKVSAEPLLFKGDGFSKTDLESAAL
ncbi:MAG: type II toxin-antitoxin system VapC family toxin [Acidobacteriota bacterium]